MTTARTTSFVALLGVTLAILLTPSAPLKAREASSATRSLEKRTTTEAT
ncbi:MAG: hypothetical protein H7X80_05800, partial [bacterium]|nr:hypothetical protein [Candidatus Kapabacteria bacterium]